MLYFYYKLFLEHPELNSLTNQKAMRALECLSIVGRDKKPGEFPSMEWRSPLFSEGGHKFCFGCGEKLSREVGANLPKSGVFIRNYLV